jgi:NAD(P)-dependent dehydrogenase (short-subunit alcohol dehydrogenase family)
MGDVAGQVALVCGASRGVGRSVAIALAESGAKVYAVSLCGPRARTEAVLAAGVFDLSNSESPEFTGRTVAALAADANALRWTGRVLVAATLAKEYGVSDVDGRQPQALTLNEV